MSVGSVSVRVFLGLVLVGTGISGCKIGGQSSAVKENASNGNAITGTDSATGADGTPDNPTISTAQEVPAGYDLSWLPPEVQEILKNDVGAPPDTGAGTGTPTATDTSGNTDVVNAGTANGDSALALTGGSAFARCTCSAVCTSGRTRSTGNGSSDYDLGTSLDQRTMEALRTLGQVAVTGSNPRTATFGLATVADLTTIVVGGREGAIRLYKNRACQAAIDGITWNGPDENCNRALNILGDGSAFDATLQQRLIFGSNWNPRVPFLSRATRADADCTVSLLAR